MDKPRRSSRSNGVDAWGVAPRYKDNRGRWQRLSEETRRAIHTAMGGTDAQPSTSGPLVVTAGSETAVEPGSRLLLEDGRCVELPDRLPPDTPPGYHELEDPRRGARRRLIVAPPQCYLPDKLPIWGWTAQLYSLRSRQSWGIGDLADLARLARWSAASGARLLCVNPLAADTPVLPLQPSPYSPSSRCFRNPIYLSVREIPGADQISGIQEAVAAGQALSRQPLVDRDAVWRLKLPALRALWDRFEGNAQFDRYVTQQGTLLETFCRFCALAERHGRDWRGWPAEFRRPDSPQVRRFAEQNASAVRFHAWIQWLLDGQLLRAEQEVRLMQDLPIGVDAGGADAWAWQDVLAENVSIGAPPDMFNQAGQNWGLPPFIPSRLRAANYEPFIQTIRAALRGAGGLRIDHVMGMFRLFWIPHGMPAGAGAYVYYPSEDLLAIVALESHRARALIVGEDLGTVEPSIRRRLKTARILSYRLMWFDEQPPSKYPARSFAAVTTHDLPTIAGLWTGQDEQDEIAAGLEPNSAGWNAIRTRLRTQARLDKKPPLEDVIRQTYRQLATTPAIVRTATLEDAAGAPHRPNMPGVIGGWPSWRRPLPLNLEELEQAPLALDIAATLSAPPSKPPAKKRPVAKKNPDKQTL